MHFFACGWILLDQLHRREGSETLEAFKETSHTLVYAEAWYAMTTTISTVGYGDFKGFVDTSPTWAKEMSYLIVTITAGMILFSKVTQEIFSYKRLTSVSEILTNETRNMEFFMYEISNRRSD